MDTIHSHEDLNNSDAHKLWQNMNRIMVMSDQGAARGDAHHHEIYVLARDCRDMLQFDQVSRDVQARLMQSHDTVHGVHISATVQAYARNNRKIEAIKQLRTDSGLGLKEAKDAVEAWMDQQNINTW
jgi:hypothetical protein